MRLTSCIIPGMFDEPMVTLRLLHYSSEKSDTNQGLYAAGQHSDYGMLTFLALDDQPGLQICTDGEWKVCSICLFFNYLFLIYGGRLAAPDIRLAPVPHSSSLFFGFG